MASRIGHVLPIWQLSIGSSFQAPQGNPKPAPPYLPPAAAAAAAAPAAAAGYPMQAVIDKTYGLSLKGTRHVWQQFHQ
jgi:hypothetical protein